MQVSKAKKGYKLIEIGFEKFEEIPEEWKICKIKDIIDKFHSGIWGEEPSEHSDSYPVIRSTEINEEGNLDLSSVKFRKITKSKISKFFLQEGDIIIVASSGSSRLIGRPTYITNLKSNKYLFSNFMLRIRMKNISPKFFYYFLKSFLYRQFLDNYSNTTTGLRNFPKKDFENLNFYLPSILEQENIVKILSNIDNTIEKINQLIEKSKLLKKGLMQKLFTKGIGHTKFKMVDLLFGKQIEIPEKWETVTLNEICKNITDGKHGDCTNEKNSGYYFISAKDIFGEEIHYDNAREITENDFLETTRRTKLEINDLLITNSGSIGKTAIAKSNKKINKTTFQKSVAILKPELEKINVSFLQNYIINNEKLLEKTSSGSSQKNLLLKHLNSFKVFLPSLSEQNQIASILSNVDSQINKEKLQKSNLEILKKGLMQKLLTGQIRVKV